MTKPMTERTWEITGSNRRTVTLAQYRAEINAAKIKALAIFKKAAEETVR
jgi:hypothetical protein